MISDPESFLRALFDAAVASARPDLMLGDFLPSPPAGRTIVVGAGKAAAAMARALETRWTSALTGTVVVPYGHAVACETIEVIEAAHPVPDEAGLAAAGKILASVRDLEKDDLVICLLSGGGSSLMSMPAEGVSLADKQGIVRALLHSGATIAEINCVRRHLSGIKGGRLGLACLPARCITLAISDVPGDDPTVIASGPTIADPTRCADALAVLTRYEIAVPDDIRNALALATLETPKEDALPDSARDFHIIATPQRAIEAAAEFAKSHGVTAIVLGDRIEGEARDVAAAQAEIARAIARGAHPTPPPVVLLSGGELTVTVRGAGRGGPNTEFALALASALDGAPGIHALAADTDGIDGAGDNAGALIGPETLARANGLGLSAEAHLRNNDALSFFQVLGGLVVTGPTLTNVNDFRAILVLEKTAD